MAGQAIYYSSDGGESWEEQYRIEGDTLTSLSFVDASNGWALSQSGNVYRYGEE